MAPPNTRTLVVFGDMQLIHSFAFEEVPFTGNPKPEGPLGPFMWAQMGCVMYWTV